MLIQNYVISRLDYCNVLYYALPNYNLKKIQNVFNQGWIQDFGEGGGGGSNSGVKMISQLNSKIIMKVKMDMVFNTSSSIHRKYHKVFANKNFYFVVNKN